jgi:hypothetical protein
MAARSAAEESSVTASPAVNENGFGFKDDNVIVVGQTRYLNKGMRIQAQVSSF